MKKIALGIFAISALAGTPAVARVKTPPAQVVATPAESWTGFYVGANASYGWGRDSGVSFTDYPPGSFAASFAAGQTPRFVGDSPNGFGGGGQAGYNYQINTNWLVGLEGDFSGTGIYSFSFPGASVNTTVSQQAFGLIGTAVTRGDIVPGGVDYQFGG